MGFLKTSSSKIKPSTYSAGAGVGMPTLSTNTTIAAGDLPKMAEMPSLEGYYRTEARRRARNGVAGTFTVEG